MTDLNLDNFPTDKIQLIDGPNDLLIQFVDDPYIKNSTLEEKNKRKLQITNNLCTCCGYCFSIICIIIFFGIIGGLIYGVGYSNTLYNRYKDQSSDVRFLLVCYIIISYMFAVFVSCGILGFIANIFIKCICTLYNWILDIYVS
jgi:hypothetical protein